MNDLFGNPLYLSQMSAGSSIKTSLFVKSNQLRQMGDQLERIVLLPKKQKDQWVKDNHMFIGQMMDELAQESTIVLEALDGDSQTVSLSMEYVTHLRIVMNAIQSIFHGANAKYVRF